MSATEKTPEMVETTNEATSATREASEETPTVTGRVRKELHAFYNGLSMTGGDFGAFTQLFFDNLSTLLGAVFALQALVADGVSTDVMNEIVWGYIVPGVGLGMIVGNIYYSWQAIRVTNKYGRQYTAQPYGLNTPAAFSFVYNIVYSVFYSNVDAIGADNAFILGYRTALAANFVSGLISIFLGCFGDKILKLVPPAALLVPIAGIGFAFLGLEQLSYSIAAPIVGYSTIMWVYLGWFSGVKVGYRKFRIPEACMVILVGIVLGWATGLNQPEKVTDAAKLVKWWGPVFTVKDMFSDFSLVVDYLGIIIPIGISAAAGTLMCLVSAKNAGDPYPVIETMVADGIGTVIACFFGSPFGTTVYIGHPAYKRSGAKVGYSLLNGTLYLIFSWFGILALAQSFVNQATIGPIVFFVGIMVCEEALEFMPARHYSAFIIGLFPSVYDWVTNVSGQSPVTVNGLWNEFTGSGTPGWYGVLAWKQGALLVSMIWVAMLVQVLNREWIRAAIWAIIGSAFAVVGIIHVPTAGFQNFSAPFWTQCVEGADGTAQCWEFAQQWMFFVAYLMLAGTFGLVRLAQKFDDTFEEPMYDESAHAFDDWFADAAKDTFAEHFKSSLTKNSLILKEHERTDYMEGVVEGKEREPEEPDPEEPDPMASYQSTQSYRA